MDALRTRLLGLIEKAQSTLPRPTHKNFRSTLALRQKISRAWTRVHGTPSEAGWFAAFCQPSETTKCSHEGSGNPTPVQGEDGVLLHDATGKGTSDCPKCGTSATSFKAHADAWQTAKIQESVNELSNIHEE